MGPGVDIAKASEITGTSRKALRSRVERGTLPAIKRNGKRIIPVAALREAGLLTEAGAVGEGQAPASAPPRGNLVDMELLDRLEAQAEELGKLRALTERAESADRDRDHERAAREAAEAEVHRLRAEVEQLRQRRRWLAASGLGPRGARLRRFGGRRRRRRIPRASAANTAVRPASLER